MGHSPEPWVEPKYGRGIEDANGETVILGIRDCDMQMQYDESAKEEDMRRIRACVNACAGIPTEDLEAMGDPTLMAATDAIVDRLIEKNRDEIVPMLESVRESLDSRQSDPSSSDG